MRLVVGVLAALLPGVAAACGEGYPLRAGEGAVSVGLRADPWPIRVSEPFGFDIVVCGAGELARIDATMPAHRHGMNYRPSLVALGDGRWRAEGLMFHMAGEWEIRLDLPDRAPLRVRLMVR